MEIECCDEVLTHDEIIKEVGEKLPGEDQLRSMADFYKVFGDATRLRILCILLQAEMCVCDLAALLSMTQSAVSHQLRILKQMRLVKNRRGWKDGVLFVGGRSYSDDYQPGNGAYCGIRSIVYK